MREKPELEVETFHYATRIYFGCDCGSHSSIRPDLLVLSEVDIDKCKPGKGIARHVNAIDFELNHWSQDHKWAVMVERKDVFYPE
jgi:hypothetical protein